MTTPPLIAPSSPTIDLAKPFTFVFEDRKWLEKVLVGGLFYAAAFLLVGIFFIAGYLARLARNVVAGESAPLPEWNRLGEMFSEGLKIVLVAVLIFLPLICFGVLFALASALMDSGGQAQNFAGCGITCVVLMFVPFVLLVTFFAPAAILNVMISGEIGDAFKLSLLQRQVRHNIGNYLLAFLIYFVGGFLSQFGIFIFCVGIVFTSFWALLISTYAFADAYRLAPSR